MKKPENKPQHLISKPGENTFGSDRFGLLAGAAGKATEAFLQGFYLEAITLTESLLADRLESRLGWVRKQKGNPEPVKFETLGNLCNALLQNDNASLPAADMFRERIKAVKEWSHKRNSALHEMAKLRDTDRPFIEKYERARDTAVEGFEVLLAYDAIDRKTRRKAGLFTATDDKHNGTSFDSLRGLVDSHKSSLVTPVLTLED